MADKYNDLPLAEIEAQVIELLERGNTVVFQKFTCTGCGERQMIDEPNRLYTSASCEACGAVTEIEKCGFALVISNQIGGTDAPKVANTGEHRAN